jgi:hypothetical protein
LKIEDVKNVIIVYKTGDISIMSGDRLRGIMLDTVVTSLRKLRDGSANQGQDHTSQTH